MGPRKGAAKASAIGNPKLIRHPVPTAEAERRLRPVLDVLYSGGNPRQALKIATQALNKRPGWPAARALRAVALHRLGRCEEAWQVAAAIVDDIECDRVPADEDAAVKLHLFYQEVPRPARLSARAFELVARKCPLDRPLSELAFVYLLHAREYASAQRVAAHLQRGGGGSGGVGGAEERQRVGYAVWMACAIWLANRAPEGNQKLLALAAAMMKKAVSSSGCLTSELLRFTTRLLCDAGEYAATRELLGRTDIALDEAELGRMRADVALRAGDKENAVILYMGLLEEGDLDDWGNWLRYLDVSENKDKAAFIERQCKVAADGAKRVRAPYLAWMEYLLREKQLDDLAEEIASYAGRMGDKSVCAHDLRPYAHAFVSSTSDADEKLSRGKMLCAKVESKCAPQVRTADQSSLEYGQRTLTKFWLQLWLGVFEESPENLYTWRLSLLDDALEETERQAGDDFLLLAAHKLLPACGWDADRYQDSAKVIEAILVLESGLGTSPYNFQFKLLLIRLYLCIGAAQRAFQIWSSLQVKHIQISSLAHLVLQPACYHGLRPESDSIAAAFDRLYGECQRDVPESVRSALSQGAVNAAVEFIEFRNLIESSAVAVEAVRCRGLTCLQSVNKSSLSIAPIEAWLAVCKDTPVLPQSIVAAYPLANTDDTRCMEFWDTHEYDVERCRVDHESGDGNGDERLSEEDNLVVAAELLVLKCVLQMMNVDTALESERLSSRNDPHGVVQSDKQENENSPETDENHEPDLSQNLQLLREVCDRLAPIRNENLRYLTSMALLFGDLHVAMSSGLEGRDSKVVQGNGVVEHSNGVAFLEKTQDALQLMVTEDGSGSCLHPRSLTAIGRFVHESLMLSALAVLSLSKISLATISSTQDRGSNEVRKKTRKSAGSLFNKYSLATRSACEKVLGLLTPVVDIIERDESQWTKSWTGHDANYGTLARYLPDSQRRSDIFGDSSARTLTRAEFCAEVIGGITESHHRSCLEIRRSAQGILQLLALSSF